MANLSAPRYARPKRWILHCLALGHYVWGAVLLAGAAWFAISALRILPHMSTGTIWSNLPAALLLAATSAIPLGTLGGWFVVLGRRLWTGHPRLRGALCWTHGVLLLIGAGAIGIGINGSRAAAMSAARGGGIMGGLAALPLVVGGATVVLALASLAVVLLLLRDEAPERPQNS